MSKITEDIKKEFDNYKNNLYEYKDSYKVCKSNPFLNYLWMYNYLFPEVLLVTDDYIESGYKHYCENCNRWGAEPIPKREFFIFPCWVLPEEEVLRIMAECGII